MQKHNFGAGPGILPQEVLQKSAADILNFNNLGLSILEISHRSKDFESVLQRAKTLVKELLNVPDDYSILFLQGGASTQFAMVPMNFLKSKAAYVDSGAWSSKAIKEAKLFGEVNVIASSKDRKYSYMPRGYTVAEDCDYVHITSNETIHGTQMKAFPDSAVPVICDMSSDIFSRVIDVSKFDLIYAGAQKNMGPAGATLVIIKNELAEKTGKSLPSMLNYKIHIENDSLYNTPSVYAVLVCMYTLEWLKKTGGVPAIEKINRQKGELFYNEVDSNSLFRGMADKEDRSLMNACFFLKNPAQDEEFLSIAKEAGIIGLKGHRSVGGFRASLYNALPLSSVQALVNVMKEFALKTA